MNLLPIAIDFLTRICSIFIPLLVLYLIIRKDVLRFLKQRTENSDKETRVHLLPLRLQAHERLILFTDRINPVNMFVRLHQQGIGIGQLQALVLNEVRSEYQHNITQQLYVDATTWQVVKKLKEDTIAMVNNAVQGLPSEASGFDLSKAILQHMAGVTENPYDLTASYIKKDIHRLF